MSMNRRDLFRLAGIGAVSAGAGRFALGCADEPPTVVGPSAPGAPAPAAPGAAASIGDASSRLLVVVELGGGNDGLSTLVPHGIGRYHDLRPATAIGVDQLVDIDGTWGVHTALAPLWQRGLAVLQGVGTERPDGSHFEMMQRWWSGTSTAGGLPGTGFLGRLCDAVGDPAAPAVGVSIGAGATPALLARQVTTLAIPGLDAVGIFGAAPPDDPMLLAFQEAMAEMAGVGGTIGAAIGGPPSMLDLARRSQADAIGFARALDGVPGQGAEGYPEGDLGRSLSLAAQLLAGVEGLRVVHVPARLDFDTHDDHVGRYPELIATIGSALDRFLGDLADRGLLDRTLVVTTSEFGRTVRDNGSQGLDHGTASVALLAGAGIVPGVHGEAPSLDALDDEDQLVATVGFDRYYATLAERWFGVPASEVLDTGAAPIDGLLAV